MRLIDAEALFEKCFESVWFCARGNGKTIMELAKGIAKSILETEIQKAPTIEAKPVVHAHWDEVSGGRIICTHCGNYPLYDYFGRLKLSDCCPSCGAIMDEK